MMSFILLFHSFCDTALLIVTFNRMIVRKDKSLTLLQKGSLIFQCVKLLYSSVVPNTRCSKSKLHADTFAHFKNSEFLQK